MATTRTQHRPTHASRQRKRLFGVTLTMALAFASASDVAQAAENSPANCTGIAVSSLAGNPGVVAFLTRGFHQEFKDAGLPPGQFDSTFSKLHLGSLEGCLG